MIEVVGTEGSPEHDAALRIRDAIVRTWPGIESTPVEEDHVKLVSNLKLSNQKISDVDIAIVALLNARRYIVPKGHAKDKDGNSVVGKPVRVRSLVAAIEVKDHSSDRIDVKGGAVWVQYSDGWKDASGQNDVQKYSLRNCLREVVGGDPWIYRCVMLRGVNDLPKVRGVPQPEACAIAANFDFTSLLVAMASLNGFQRAGSEIVVRSGDDALMQRVLEAPYFRPLVPSSLDRRRMDRIASRPAEARSLSSDLGSKRMHLRGHGGTGKTVLLLQTAYDAYVERGVRSLVLTYNVALAADIQRTLALMGIPSEGEAGGISVKTVMSYMFSWLHRLGLVSGEEDGFEDYEAKCAEALRYLEEGALGQKEIEAVKRLNPDTFSFDAILVDEAQDWPQSEADLLARLHGGDAIALADGTAQLIRGAATNWKSTVAAGDGSGERFLRDGLRMKANLCRFANAVAEEVCLNWNIGVNQHAAGGRVFVVCGSYATEPELQLDVLGSAVRAGNMPIDLLHCVPPSTVREMDGRKVSLLGQKFLQNSRVCWDGVDPVARRSFPRSLESLRIVQYESCRGLEGWAVVLEGLDEFWDLKYAEALRDLKQSKRDQIDPEAAAEAAAWRWLMIPLTRPIDSLVITVGSFESRVGRMLLRLSKQMSDVIDLRKSSH